MDSCNIDCPIYSLGPHAGKGRIRVATPLYCTVQSVGDAHPTRHGRPWHLQGPAGCVGWESKTALPEWRGKRVAPRAHTNLSCKGLMLSAFETVQVYFSSGLYGKLPCNGEAARRGASRWTSQRGAKKGFSYGILLAPSTVLGPAVPPLDGNFQFVTYGVKEPSAKEIENILCRTPLCKLICSILHTRESKRMHWLNSQGYKRKDNIGAQNAR